MNVQRFPEIWNPPSGLSYHIGRKPASSKSQKVDPITDQEIIDLINSLENFEGAVRDKPAALNWARVIKLMAAFGLRPEELKHLEKEVDKRTKEEFLWCSYQKRAGGGMTEPRKLYALYLMNKKGIKQDWDLVTHFDQKDFQLPPLQRENGVGEDCSQYLATQKGWHSILETVEKRKERAGSYSFRYAYSVRGHQLDFDGGSMATAMGHSYETHCREYLGLQTVELTLHSQG